MNVTWRSNWLEWIMVTPRYPPYSSQRQYRRYANANFGVTFSVWDRLFGTYRDPETFSTDLPSESVRRFLWRDLSQGSEQGVRYGRASPST